LPALALPSNSNNFCIAAFAISIVISHNCVAWRFWSSSSHLSVSVINYTDFKQLQTWLELCYSKNLTEWPLSTRFEMFFVVCLVNDIYKCLLVWRLQLSARVFCCFYFEMEFFV
jgi:hypothetical protein